MKIRTTVFGVLLGCLLISGCGQQQAQAKANNGGGGILIAVNHTQWEISDWSVNGVPGVDIIGPYQGGGGACCFSIPGPWKPGMTVRVEWVTGRADTAGFPGFSNREKLQEWKREIIKSKKTHSIVALLPDYNGHEVCGINVHFLPCDEVKVTNTCITVGAPGYPYNYPLRMPEPKTCPKN